MRDIYGLLTTDSTILAAAIDLGIEHLATNDSDLDAVTDVLVHRPLDVP